MKKHLVFLATLVFMFLLVTFWVTAEETGNNPVVVSPGSETEVVTVWQSCPTFSWSSVDQAASYRIAVFESVDERIAPYESMAVMSAPVISKQISGPALSWTLSSEESLKTGSMYAWYVQALDASGNAIGSWSGGRIFQVEQDIQFVGIKEKLGEILKSYGVSDKTAANVLNDLKSEVPEVVVNGAGNKNTPGISSILGTSNSYYTAYGYQAGDSVQDDTSIYSLFVGVKAGYSNTTGGAFTLLGHYAGYYSTASANTFVGSGAGTNTATGALNTFVGKEAGNNNDYGDEGNYIGAYAGYSNNYGSRFTFFGYNAGYSKTGYHEQPSATFAGCESGYSTTSGLRNTFLGDSAGYSNTSGNNSTYIGYYTGYSNTGATGQDNSFLGYKAGYANTSGYYNLFMGASVGYNNTGNSNIFLGYKAGYNETGTNKLYIANSDTSSPLIYGEFDNSILIVNGKLGIGTKTPAYPIEVDTTGTNSCIVVKRTDGATNYINATDAYANFGSVTDHPLRLVVNSTWKMRLDSDGSLTMSNGATLTSGGTWTNASSRALKENIENLNTNEAVAALDKLNPVKYNYKVDKTDKHVGFIAEDVPELVAAADRKGLSPMDITAVLTKVVQELQEENREYKKNISELLERVATLEKK